MFGRSPILYFVVASVLAVVALAGVVALSRLVMPQQPVVQVSPQGDADAASRAMTFSPKDGSR